MKRSTFSILAVALTTVGCGGAAPVGVNLQTLNEELAITTTEQALLNTEHFRPLCDEQGYPVVGNLNTKAVSTASQFCAGLRAKETKK